MSCGCGGSGGSTSPPFPWALNPPPPSSPAQPDRAPTTPQLEPAPWWIWIMLAIGILTFLREKK
jgi:hypothetical protein